MLLVNSFHNNQEISDVLLGYLASGFSALSTWKDREIMENHDHINKLEMRVKLRQAANAYLDYRGRIALLTGIRPGFVTCGQMSLYFSGLSCQMKGVRLNVLGDNGQLYSSMKITSVSLVNLSPFISVDVYV